MDKDHIGIKELSREVHSDSRLVKFYIEQMGINPPYLMKDKERIIEYVLDHKRDGTYKRIRNKTRSVNPSKKLTVNEDIPTTVDELVAERNRDYKWHVSIKGLYGWIVIHIGTKDEMEGWARLLRHNDIECRVEENTRLLMAYTDIH